MPKTIGTQDPVHRSVDLERFFPTIVQMDFDEWIFDAAREQLDSALVAAENQPGAVFGHTGATLASGGVRFASGRAGEESCRASFDSFHARQASCRLSFASCRARHASCRAFFAS
jgi:hypothetical protein